MRPGKSEVDQLFKICSQLGTPDDKRDKEIVNLAIKLNFKFPLFTSQPIEIENARPEAIQFIGQLLNWNPMRRLNASNCLKHNYFKNLEHQQPTTKIVSSSSRSIMKQNQYNGSNRVNDMMNSKSVNINLSGNQSIDKVNEKLKHYSILNGDIDSSSNENDFDNCKCQ